MLDAVLVHLGEYPPSVVQTGGDVDFPTLNGKNAPLRVERSPDPAVGGDPARARRRQFGGEVVDRRTDFLLFVVEQRVGEAECFVAQVHPGYPPCDPPVCRVPGTRNIPPRRTALSQSANPAVQLGYPR